jgi:hypothetical protein
MDGFFDTALKTFLFFPDMANASVEAIRRTRLILAVGPFDNSTGRNLLVALAPLQGKAPQ